MFFSDEDRLTYLDWLTEYADRHDVEILAYCLMDNHVHLIAVPAAEPGLQNVMKPLHMRYAQRLNRRNGWIGHVWQGRYYSAPLDEPYLWTATRYVERNPVRAGLVRRAEEFAWSSAAGHCGLKADRVVTDKPTWRELFAQVDDWSAWLADDDEPARLAALRRSTMKGLPCGAEQFVRRLEERAGRALRTGHVGRPKNHQPKQH